MKADLTILIVDDEKLQREIATGMLEDVGYSVIQASGGKEALNILKKKTVDLILLDIVMPKLDGIETCRQIKKINHLKTIPIIMLTALNNEDDVVRALDAGADDFINKASASTIVLARINAHLRTKQFFNEIDRIRKAEASVMDVILDITSTQDIRKVLQLLTEKTSKQIGMDVSVFLTDESKQSGTIAAYSDGNGKKDFHIDLSKYPEIRESLLTKKPVFISDTENNPLVKEVSPLLKELDISSIMVIPLVFHDETMGALILKVRGSEKGFDEEDIRLSKIMAGVASNAIKNASTISLLKEQKIEIEKAHRVKSEFLAIMSHELRTPLSSIIGFSEMISQEIFGKLSEDLAECVEDIRESGNLLLSQINDILAMCVAESGELVLEFSDVDITSLIDGCVILFKKEATNKGLEITVRINENVGTVYADELRLKQALVNLISNAVKFTHEGGCITVRASKSVGRESLEISVRDTGIGIREEEIPLIFRTFQQLDSSFSRTYSGVGLGLALSRRIVELHGGRIWVESEEGEGSTFAFTIPGKDSSE